LRGLPFGHPPFFAFLALAASLAGLFDAPPSLPICEYHSRTAGGGSSFFFIVSPFVCPRHLDDALIVVEPGADSLSIRTQYTGSDAEHPTSVEYRITVPRRIHLDSVVLTNGQLSLDGLSGPIKASAVNGDIHALNLGGRAELSTVNGRVDANFDRTSPANPISLSSVNGAIALTLPRGSGASLEAQNLSGGIASDVGLVSRTDAGHRLVVKGAGPRIRLHNVNGGISIHSTEHPCT